VIISRIVLGGSRELPPPTAAFQPPPYYDVSGDNRISPHDAAQVIAHITKFGSGEGSPRIDAAEAAATSTLVMAAASALPPEPVQTQMRTNLVERLTLDVSRAAEITRPAALPHDAFFGNHLRGRSSFELRRGTGFDRWYPSEDLEALIASLAEDEP
jgi:hypothetical protein